MKVVITGAAGFLGRRLAERLAQRGALVGPDGRETAIDELALFDIVTPQPVSFNGGMRVSATAGDVADASVVRRLIDSETGSVFHLAAVVSSEADTDLGLHANLDGTRAVLEACRALGTAPRLVFASSLAVYGGDLPSVVGEDTPPTPQTSYGAQKAIGELLVNDYTRKGFIDGRAVRLPTVAIRPGRPNRAASTWASSIIREPLSGVEAVCPVTRDTVMAILSPRRALAAIEQIHNLPGARLGTNRTLLLPGISVTVDQMVEALGRAGGEDAIARIRWEPDPAIQKIVDGWPRALVAGRAASLRIAGDRDIDEVVRTFVEDDLAAQKALAGTA